MKRSPLKRKTPLKRGGRLPARSKKRAAQERLYNKRVKEWKLENPLCEACVPIADYLNQTADTIWHVLPHPTRDNHHMAGKEGALLLDEKWWLPVCRHCHNWIGEHSNTARELGLLAPKNM